MRISRKDHEQYPRWRMTLTILCLLGVFASLCESAPTGLEPKTSTLERLDSPKDSSIEQLGSPVELAWRTWLAEKTQKGGSLSEDPATLVRRITPKSIFIAPQINTGCGGQGFDENYDENRCKYVKTLSVNSSLHKKFILERLNAKHDRQKQQEQQQLNKALELAGPFQLNIPFNDTPKVPETPKPLEILPLEVKVPESNIQIDSDKKADDASKDGITTAKINTPEETLSEHVPVVDFVHEEANESFTDSIVDYKIPLTAKRMDEGSKKEAESGDHFQESDNEEQPTTTIATTTPKYVQPTLIVLYSAPTKAPETVRSESLGDAISQIDANSTGNWTGKDDPSPVVPIEEDASDAINSNLTKNVTQDAIGVNATQETDDIYSDEDPLVTEEDADIQDDYSTEDSITESVEDDFAETTEDELLRPGEAGMTIPIITNQQQLDKAEWHKEDSVDKVTSIETPEPVSTVKPANASLVSKEAEIPTTAKPEDDDANVSSEVSINGDFILETTLVDVNTERIKNATEPAATNVDFVAIKVDKDDQVPKQFEPEKEEAPAKPEVLVFSTSVQEPHHPQPSPHIRPVIVWGVDEETAKRQNNNPLKLNLGLVPIPPKDVLAEQTSDPEKIIPPDAEEKFQLPPSHKQQNLGFVRFPGFEDRPHSSSYVRFPSDEVNSIHNLDFKPRLPHPRDDFVSTTSTKSSVPFYQKQSHWHRNSRTDRQHSGFKQQWNDSSNRQAKVKQQANLQDFWAKLPPLIPDSVHLPTTSHGSHNEPYGGDSLRRSRFK